MKQTSRQWLSWVGVVALIIGIQFAASRHLASGHPPLLEGQSLQGGHFSLGQWHGQAGMVYFWASWCPICRGMDGSVAKIAEDYPVMTVATQSGNAAELARYLQSQQLALPTLPDESGELSDRYGLRGVPAVFVIGPGGEIRFATTGYTSEWGMRLRLWLASQLR